MKSYKLKYAHLYLSAYDILNHWKQIKYLIITLILFQKPGEWKNIRLQYPNSILETDHRKDACDVWDSVSFYLNRNNNATTSSPSTTQSYTTADVVPTTHPDVATTVPVDVATTAHSGVDSTTEDTDIENTTAGVTNTLHNSFVTFILLVSSLNVIL